jgi:conjugative relaxase-like TrwC/TraI family protein
VLSIGKVGMSEAQQMYYEQQVAAGREDYYAGKGEAPGRWTGKGAELLGLSGELNAEALKAMMDGRHPETGEQLANRRGNCNTAAIDMTFSAPKSVSVLFAVGDEDLSAALVEAHEEAVNAALGYMEDVACKVRRGHNGTAAEREAGDPRGSERARPEPAGGFLAAAYRHRMSRAQDPQLHTHCVAANMARGADGRWTALDARHIYDHAKAGGAVYQAHLRAAVRERLRWASWGPVREAMAELEQIPDEVCREFSTRRIRILERERELVADGVAVGDAGRERIAYDTREVKHEVEEGDWRTEIRSRAAEHGLGKAEVDALAELIEAPAAETVSESALAAGLFSPGGLTARSNTFRERDVVIAVAAAQRQGRAAGEVVAVARGMLEHEEAVAIPEALDRRYTTSELLDAEQQIVAHATEGRGRQAAIVDPGRVEGALTGLPRALTDEQQKVITAIASSGNRIDTVEALAGTGKTTSAAALREVYEQAGYRVIGAAPTGRAVRELKERAGIEDSRTLDGWALKLGADPDTLRLAQSTQIGARRVPAVMIIDEAGMAHTRLSAKLIDAAVDARVKVVAIGDSGQLSSVQAGGWLGALTRRHGSHELREVMRQRDPQERRGLAQIHRGQPDSYLELKSARGELHVFAGETPGIDAERNAIEQWVAARETYGASEAVLISRDNQRRERLNELAREHLEDRGELGESVQIAGREWAVGDRVIARRNDRGRDLDNGMRATITHVDPENGVTIQADSGGVRQLDIDYTTHHLEHAYALTGHGMQGGTVQWAAVIGQSGDFTRNWSYTALSRAREPTEILLVDEPSRAAQEREEIAPAEDPAERSAPVARMAVRMRERDDEDLALEQLEHAAREQAVQESDRGDEQRRERLETERRELVALSSTNTPRMLELDIARNDEQLDRHRSRLELLESSQPGVLDRRGRSEHDHALKDARSAVDELQVSGRDLRERLQTLRDRRTHAQQRVAEIDHELKALGRAQQHTDAPSVATEASDDEATVRDPVRVPDPVERLRGPLGPQRAQTLAERLQQHAARVEQRTDAELVHEHEQAAPALAALDGASAYETRRLGNAADQAADRQRAAAERAGELEGRAEQLGWRQRQQREQLLAEARVQRQAAAHAGRELAEAREREQQLHGEGRHPDEWLARHGEQAAIALAAERELAVRRERSIQAHADRAIEQPPAHLRDMIGERPAEHAAEQRERWDQLARDLERHRLRHQVDVERDTTLGPPEPPTGDHGQYRRDREQLSRRVQDLRNDRGLQPARDLDPPDLDLDLDL